jgi:outer membrane protein assembly factor BamD (BamD/ComL family)
MKGNMYYILENHHDRFYTEALANYQFPSLQAAQDKLQALQTLAPGRNFFIVSKLDS